MYLLQLAQFFGHLVDALLLLALFSHGAVTSLSACATTGTVRSPERLGIGPGPSPQLSCPSFNRLLRLTSTSAASSAADIPGLVSRYSPCAVRLGLG